MVSGTLAGVIRFILLLPVVTLAIGFVLGAWWMYARQRSAKSRRRDDG